MATPILKRRLNPLLLISTVAALSLLAGVAVIAQDQVVKAHDEMEEAQRNLSQEKERVDRLRTEVQNKTAKIRQIRGNSSELQDRVGNLSSELEEKRDTIQSLRDQLDEQRQALNQSDTIQELNSSLGVVCSLVDDTDSVIENNCNEWNHEVGTNAG